MEEDTKRWTAKRKSALVLDIILGRSDQYNLLSQAAAAGFGIALIPAA